MDLPSLCVLINSDAADHELLLRIPHPHCEEMRREIHNEPVPSTVSGVDSGVILDRAAQAWLPPLTYQFP